MKTSDEVKKNMKNRQFCKRCRHRGKYVEYLGYGCKMKQVWLDFIPYTEKNAYCDIWEKLKKKTK